jgi:hypothetical protein
VNGEIVVFWIMTPCIPKVVVNVSKGLVASVVGVENNRQPVGGM